MNRLEECPPADLLGRLLTDELSEAELEAIEAHLDGCERCQETLDSLANEEAPAVHGGFRPHHDETALKDAMDALKDETQMIQESASLDFLEPSDNPNHLGKLGRYEVSAVLGRGGFGVVFKAFDPVLLRVVAIKTLSPALASNASARRRFVREAQASAAVTHEHVVAIHAIEESAGAPYLVMPYIAGISLQQKLDRDGPLEVSEILRIGMQASFGLAAAHAQGLIHRDVKPANILLENGVQRVKITDFGLARAVDDASMTQSGAIAGTPLYMAPEQARGEARPSGRPLQSWQRALCHVHRSRAVSGLDRDGHPQARLRRRPQADP